MRVTYLYSPTIFNNIHNTSYRVIVENLLRDERIEPEFINPWSQNQEDEIDKDILLKKLSNKIHPNMLKFLSVNPTKNFHHIYKFSSFYLKNYEEIPGEYILITCVTTIELIYVRHLLNLGKKVVIGGQLCNIYNANFIRNLLSSCGTKNLHNLLIVSGFISLNTDLFAIIKTWKDVCVSEPDHSSVFDCYEDKLGIDLFDDTKCYNQTPIGIVLVETCWWNKCEFCFVNRIRKENIAEGVESEKIVENLTDLCIKYSCKKIWFEDNYIQDTKRHREIFRSLRNSGIKVHINTGVQLLKNDKYMKFIADYTDTISVGFETASDYTLNLIKKGYLYEDIKKAVNNIVTYYKDSKSIVPHTLIDLPMKNKDEIKKNYKYIVDMKEKFLSVGLSVSINKGLPLILFPEIEILRHKDQIIPTTIEETPFSKQSGMWYLLRSIEQAGSKFEIPESFFTPYYRKDIDGNLLESDLNYMDKKDISFLWGD